MHDDETLDDSWFDRPAKGQALTIEMVQAALRTGVEVGPRWDGLEDSWFERKPTERKRG
ncbi:MAG: hypothetical protein K1X94_22985 [Sandaracinaceae bacterium]|nr:hypothetical protein [Sandaracinaceae bacterium]